MASILSPRTLPDDVVRYCETHDLLAHLETAFRLADECFAPIDRLDVEIQEDPEIEDEQTVVVALRLHLNPEEALKRDETYTRRWVKSVPPDVTTRIVLVYYLD